MLERTHALAGHFAAGTYGSPGEPSVVIELVPNLILWQLAAWPESAARIQRLGVRCIGAEPISDAQQRIISSRHGTLLQIEPLKWWLYNVEAETPKSEHGTVLDLSHSRTHLRISGARAATLLNRHLPLDLRSSQTAQPRVMSSAIHHVGVTLWESSQGYELFIPRSFALSLFELLCRSSEQFGYELR